MGGYFFTMGSGGWMRVWHARALAEAKPQVGFSPPKIWRGDGNELG
jgi:hypothetical protein